MNLEIYKQLLFSVNKMIGKGTFSAIKIKTTKISDFFCPHEIIDCSNISARSTNGENETLKIVNLYEMTIFS